MRREKIERAVSEPVKKAWRWSGCSGTYHVNERREKILGPCLDSKFQIFFRHLHGDLNLGEIKNALRLLFVNGETNLMNLIRL